ncbi:NAD(P)H-hydrate dehydratase [Marisediminicola sp. LYQ134]|uniref:ADP-dependent NAD(P)H-hydrate dehydratase n=1 Tax=Marisediminicola sp. LYQ134 TaxID=3391061 RepID=UPI0039831404
MTFRTWTPADSARHIAVPQSSDDKYSRGVLGVVTGSTMYPGAAVLGVEAALHTGVGMLRYLGDSRPTDLVLQRRPEVVTADGRVQAWLLGSGIDAETRDDRASGRLRDAIAQGVPTVLDAGALDLVGEVAGASVITPHYGELGRMLGVDRSRVADEPALWAERASVDFGVTVLLKGSSTFVADAHGSRLVVTTPTSWLATAGAGDALGGILGALVATHSAQIERDERTLARLAATAASIHGAAAAEASAGGPLTVLDLAYAVPRVIADMLAAL